MLSRSPEVEMLSRSRPRSNSAAEPPPPPPPAAAAAAAQQQPTRQDSTIIPALEALAVDATGSPVFVDLQGEQPPLLDALRASLLAAQPSPRQLSRLVPFNQNRLIWELSVDGAVVDAFERWLTAIWTSEGEVPDALRQLLTPLGHQWLVVGAAQPGGSKYEK